MRLVTAALEAFARRDVANLLAAGQRYPTLGLAEEAVTSDLEHEFVANPAPDAVPGGGGVLTSAGYTAGVIGDRPPPPLRPF